MSSSFNLSLEGSSYCNLNEGILADDSESGHRLPVVRVSLQNAGGKLISVFQKWQLYHWFTVCSCILCLISLVFAFSVIFSKGSHDDNAESTSFNSTCTCHQTLLNESATGVTNLECGGLIQIPQDGTPIILDYKSKHLYNNNENCLWILNTVIANVRYAVDLKVTLVSEGFSDPEDTVSILDWYDFHTLTPFPLRKGVETIVPDSYWLFLSFSTNDAVNGNGFVIQLEATRTGRKFPGSNWVFTTTPGNFTHVHSADEERTGVVINPKTYALAEDEVKWTLSGTFDDAHKTHSDGSCYVYDTMYVFSVGLKGESTKRKTLCYKDSFDLYINDAIVVNYINTDPLTGGGFTLRWS